MRTASDSDRSPNRGWTTPCAPRNVANRWSKPAEMRASSVSVLIVLVSQMVVRGETNINRSGSRGEE
jgi:hypothetical protein